MPFVSYPSPADVARAHRITMARATFVVPLPLALPEHFRAELAFAQNEVVYDNSEFAICENLIYPVLKEVWKSYLNDFVLWSHQPLSADGDLCGTPDYMLAQRSPLGREILEQPYVLIVEAKKDDPSRGWGQCLAAMVAAQRLNAQPDQVIYGITSNGRSWEFGKLQASHFTRELRLFTLSDLDELCGAVHFVFAQCRLQLLGSASAT
jgi:hypothetical protein